MPPTSSDYRSNGRNQSDRKIERKLRTGTKILIDQSKKEGMTVHSGLRGLHRRLKANWTVEINQDEITNGTFIDVRAIIFPLPRVKFNAGEMDALTEFLNNGGCIFVMMSEGGEQKADTNINFLLEQYGISVNNDTVIRTIFYKYFDPKEALISNGILNRSIPSSANVSITNEQKANAQAMTFVYPYGSTLHVNRFSTPVLSSGSACFPISRPVAAFHETEGEIPGRIIATGSVHMFSDAYIDKEENSKLFDVFMEYLINGFELNRIDATEPELNDYHAIPDHIHMSEQLKVCMQEGDLDVAFNGDFMKCFESSLSSFDLSLWPKILRAYEQFGMKAEPLTLIVPQFEVPMPPLQPAVFPPNFCELPPPRLELCDLDEMFSSPEVRLAQLANKCEENDLDYFIMEVGTTLGITPILQNDERTAKGIMAFIFSKLFAYKKLGQDGADLQEATMHQVMLTDGLGGIGERMEFSATANGAMPELSHEQEEELFSDIDEYDDL
ncbi:hypothetical protein WR25_16654 [Diploscapter pachys]|uniref:ABC-type uncharacterized transport system domain-containing protein n=1 Tax=Diploscapter pachys TaxID=2018661 RepID=A0A2A2KDQ8_9BILA|nr:hypothetical protein WR25_16654 [Diploscapter pachys]